MAYNNSYGIQAVDAETFQAMEEAVPVCLGLIHRCVCPYAGQCMRIQSVPPNAPIARSLVLVQKHNSCQDAPLDFACSAAQVYCNAAIESKYVATGA